MFPLVGSSPNVDVLVRIRNPDGWRDLDICPGGSETAIEARGNDARPL